MTKDEALRLALEALENIDRAMPFPVAKLAIKECKAALEAKDEPVAWQYRDANDDGTWSAWTGCDKRLTESDWRKVRPLYTTPPQRTWVGLTDEEIVLIVAECAASHQHTDIHFARAIEAKLKERNT